MYNELTARGSQSVSEALKVGGAIEEIDILDLQESLSRTDNTDIQQVYNNLLRASSSHLRAFARTLQTQTGETYQPQYMEMESYTAVLNSSSQGGYGSGRQGNQAGQGSQGDRGGQGGGGSQGGQGYRGGRGAAVGTP
jgi:rubrerythrin